MYVCPLHLPTASFVSKFINVSPRHLSGFSIQSSASVISHGFRQEGFEVLPEKLSHRPPTPPESLPGHPFHPTPTVHMVARHSSFLLPQKPVITAAQEVVFRAAEACRAQLICEFGLG